LSRHVSFFDLTGFFSLTGWGGAWRLPGQSCSMGLVEFFRVNAFPVSCRGCLGRLPGLVRCWGFDLAPLPARLVRSLLRLRRLVSFRG
jgi:hypothetical protein